LPAAAKSVATAGDEPAEANPAGTASAAAELPALRILLVDDDEYNRLILGRYLTAPVVVNFAVNGRDAVEAAIAQQPDVILMDVDMPGMNGFDATREVRSQERELGRQPCAIMALSSYDDAATRERSRDAGCDLYLTKPVTRTVLYSALRQLAGERNMERHALPDNELTSSSHVIEVDPDMKDVITAFVQSRRSVLDEIERTLETRDFVQLRRLAHRLAGSLGLYGFRRASDQALRLEKAAQNGNRELFAEVLSALRRHLETVEVRCGDEVIKISPPVGTVYRSRLQ
jgi:CheY-like chemotaxis protein/HPt (histidine-containing phosphotransfer) domain-containing protein